MRKNMQELDELHEQLDMAKHENALLRHKLKSMSISNDQGTAKSSQLGSLSDISLGSRGWLSCQA